MRRIAGLAIGLILLAMGLSAQTPTISQTRSQRTVQSTSATVGDTTTLTYVVQDSFRTRVVQRYKPADSLALATLRKALADTAAALKVAKDSLAKWPKPCKCDSVPVPPKDSLPTPPKDSLPTPPADTTKPSGSVLFQSDWSGGDLLDGGKWVRWGGNGSLTIQSAAGLGFPGTMKNVLRVQHYQQDFDWVMANNKWSPPAIGSSIAFRVYLRNTVSDAVDAGPAYASTHPIESEGGPNGISGQFYAIHYGSYTDGTYPFFLGVDQASYPLNGWTPGANTTTHGGRNYDPGTLKKNTTYRLEWKFTRVSASAYDLDMRIVGPDDRTVLFDKNSIFAWGGNKSQTLAASGKALPIDAAHMSDLRFGINGGFATPSPQFVYWGGFAVCADWCGAY